MIRATDLSRSYDGAPVLEGLGLSVEAGEVVAVIGPSGVGKTTLLRLLALSEQPDAGRIELDGVDLWALENGERLRERRRIAMVFQEASLFDASVAQNVEYGLRIRRRWPERIRNGLRALARRTEPAAAVREALETVGMAEKRDQAAASLSGGEAQRVSFARALACEPDALLLDEPTSDLDPRNTAVLEDAVAEARDRDIAVLLATHDMHQAERVADRVAVLLDGGIIERGPTRRIFESPADDRTRQFISGELVY